MTNYKPLEFTEYDDGGFDIFTNESKACPRSVGILNDGKIVWESVTDSASPEEAESYALALLMAARKSREITSK